MNISLPEEITEAMTRGVARGVEEGGFLRNVGDLDRYQQAKQADARQHPHKRGNGRASRRCRCVRCPGGHAGGAGRVRRARGAAGRGDDGGFQETEVVAAEIEDLVEGGGARGGLEVDAGEADDGFVDDAKIGFDRRAGRGVAAVDAEIDGNIEDAGALGEIHAEKKDVGPAAVREVHAHGREFAEEGMRPRTGGGEELGADAEGLVERVAEAEHPGVAAGGADLAEVAVDDCRWTPCFDCGVCDQMDTEIQIGPTGVVNLPTGAWYDPLDASVPGTLDKHGNPNLLTLDKGTSRLTQGCTAHTTLVEVERHAGDLPPITAFDPPPFTPSTEHR